MGGGEERDAVDLASKFADRKTKNKIKEEKKKGEGKTKEGGGRARKVNQS